MRWIIGDVHGMLRPLEALVAAVRRADAEAELYFCGDYCDRGPDTRGVVDLLLSLGRARFVRGNHDDVMDLCCNGTCFAVGGGELAGPVEDEVLVDVFDAFWREGLAETLWSYERPAAAARGSRPAGLVPAAAQWVRERFDCVPEAHKRFFRTLPAVAEAEDFFVAHATWPADQIDAAGRMNSVAAGDAVLRHEVLWGRYVANQLRSPKAWRRPGYFGHTPTLNYAAQPDLVRDPDLPAVPIHAEKVTLLDTAAFAVGGLLTAYCHDDARTLQADRDGDVIALP